MKKASGNKIKEPPAYSKATESTSQKQSIGISNRLPTYRRSSTANHPHNT